jgi:HEAT repeats
MNCDLAHERIVMAAYGELPDDAAHELERHLASCGECQKEREQLRALKLLADAYPVQEPEANLVARSRLRLEEALDAVPPKGWLERFVQRLSNNFASLQAAPLAACLLLLVGGGAGALGGYHVAQSRAAHDSAIAQPPEPTAPANPVEVANVSSIVRQPNSEQVEVHYNKLVPSELKGSLDDPAIRQLLMLASQNATSSDVHDDSIELLAAECRAGHGCKAAGIREALMVVLRYDRNAGVRQKALEGLQPYVAEDVRVRDAVLEALMNDSDPHIRTAAINMLEPVDADTSVRQVLHTVANSDRNPQIRLVSRQVLSRVSEIQ